MSAVGRGEGDAGDVPGSGVARCRGSPQTLDRYGHLLPGQAQSVTERLDEMARLARPSTVIPVTPIEAASSRVPVVPGRVDRRRASAERVLRHRHLDVLGRPQPAALPRPSMAGTRPWWSSPTAPFWPGPYPYRRSPCGRVDGAPAGRPDRQLGACSGARPAPFR